MCNSASHNFLRDLPKCEHHIHLEGALTPTLVFKLSNKNSIPLPSRPWYASAEALQTRYDAKFDSLQDFLDIHFANMAVLIDQSDYEQLAWDYFTQAHEDGVQHAEVFCDPQSHTARGVDISIVIKGFSAACRRAEHEFGMTTRLIMCFLRHLPLASATETLVSAKRLVDDGTISGVGLSSSEVGFPPEIFQSVFKLAKEQGLRRTAHGGEEGDPSYIRGALTSLDAERIDHGIRAVEDPKLMLELAASKTLLTVCPLSNLYLKVVDSLAELPLRTFLELGVQFSLNSDDPAYFGGGVLNNYCAVQEAFKFTVNEWGIIAEAGINGSWIEDARKQELLQRVRDVVQQYS